MTKRAIHFDRRVVPGGFAIARGPMCSIPLRYGGDVAVTKDPEKVTCKRCFATGRKIQRILTYLVGVSTDGPSCSEDEVSSGTRGPSRI